MSARPELEAVSLDDLARDCTQQIDHFRRRVANDMRTCFEIFRRAVIAGDERAWSIFAEQNRFQIARWAQRHPAFGQCGEELDDVVAFVLAKVWLTFASDKNKLSRFAHFQSLMKYLKMCVHSAIVDALRANRSTGPELEDIPITPQLDPIPARDLWDAVSSRLKDEHERLVMKALFVYGLEPRDVLKRFPNRFSGAGEIYRIKQNVVARLRRDPEFKRLFGGDD